ncbi:MULTISPECIES: 4-hydroxy-tetrahydrodipicolinate reductase [Methanobacterium]|uniref:4-hydroxy-tetrahydrodipicolinate reductase n=1 Tax=Methanobacterium veterum TaxID=408577 RepID=A0A9E5DPG7_9EURY|nr:MULTISPECIES: 4-hydroxy-tetrahydrodipicolinate reductase [Methanobacterium]MCZ3366932.1 4-hydroxy-tetrahydrodipicolinate reductase [Methanobacterium veterum]MCZ3373921.1 4-hydroxy-tetrahydrodipicolinate reductase [Methanobacterium veterum]
MIGVAVTGASGRMGSKIIRTILEQDDMKVVAAIEAPNTPFEGKDVGEVISVGTLGVPVNGAEKLAEVLTEKKPDVLVDFTIANAAVGTIKTSAECGVNVVVGTTGFSDEQMEEMKNAIEKNNIKAVIAPNMAVGVNVFFKIIADLAKILKDDYDVEIIEAHHKHKADAPSGTAVKAYEVLAEALGRDTNECGVYGRQGMVGARTPEEIGIHAVRGGDIVGDHTVLFAGEGERIEIVHRAHSRQAFVSGVIKAVRYVVGASKKISDMGDVLGIK